MKNQKREKNDNTDFMNLEWFKIDGLLRESSKKKQRRV